MSGNTTTPTVPGHRGDEVEGVVLGQQDLDRDGTADIRQVDTDGDGRVDATVRDLNDDGRPDQVEFDTDGGRHHRRRRRGHRPRRFAQPCARGHRR